MQSGASGSPAEPSPLRGRSVFCTGGTGTFGKAFARRALADGCRRFVVFSRDELKQSQMAAEFPDPRMRFFVGDVRDSDRLLWAMKGAEIVVHAAAMKRIEVCEANPGEAVATNVTGSINVAKVAIQSGASKAILLSTDKAPNAATLYGATKFCAERLWNACNVLAAGRATRLTCTRYGNVLGSRGSVADIFKQHAANGTPAPITSTHCTRFWMTIGDAVDLVLLALANMRGGEVYVPKAPSAPLLTLADALGVQSYTSIGLRAAERLHETLISSDEARTTYDAGTHYVIEPESRTWEELPALAWPKVAPDFAYRSDTNPRQASVAELARMVAA